MASEDRVTDDEYQELQRRFGGQYVARRSGKAIIHSVSFDALMDAVAKMTAAERKGLIIQYFDPADVVSVY